MGRLKVGFALLLAVFVVLSAGCLKGGNFVYSKGKTLSPGAELTYPFKGPVNLSVKVSSSVPVEVKVVGKDGVLRDFGRTTKVNTVVPLPDGEWKVVIRNPGKESARLDIELRGS
ncbi:hypothetical protein [Thermococcus sp.]